MSLHEEVKQEGGKGDMKERQKATQAQPPLDYQLMAILCVSHTYPLLSRPAIGEEKIIVERE